MVLVKTAQSVQHNSIHNQWLYQWAGPNSWNPVQQFPEHKEMSIFFVSAFLWVDFKIFSMYICRPPTAAAHGCNTSAGNMARLPSPRQPKPGVKSLRFLMIFGCSSSIVCGFWPIPWIKLREIESQSPSRFLLLLSASFSPRKPMLQSSRGQWEMTFLCRKPSKNGFWGAMVNFWKLPSNWFENLSVLQCSFWDLGTQITPEGIQ